MISWKEDVGGQDGSAGEWMRAKERVVLVVYEAEEKAQGRGERWPDI